MSAMPYPTYKESGISWLGKMPAHWDLVQFKQFVDIQNGCDHKHVEQTEGYPVYGSGGVFTYASDYLYDGESVLLGRKGTIDKPLYVTDRFWTVDTMYWTKIRPNVSGRYTYFLALTIPFSFYSTNTALPSMTKGSLNSHMVMLPPHEEQTTIASFLDQETNKIDALVEEQTRLIELLKEKRQAVISHAVTKGLNPDAPMRDSGIEWIGEVPAHWEVKRLKKILSEPLMYGANEAAENDDHSHPRYVRITDITASGDLKADTFRSLKPEVAAPYILNEGNILLARSGATVGKSFIYQKSWGVCCFAGYLIKATINPVSALPRYIYNCLQTSFYWQYISSEQIQATIQNMSAEKYGELFLPVPPLEEQNNIVGYLHAATTKIDTLIAAAQSGIGLLHERRSALISAAVTGKIDVRDFAKRQAEAA